jgi:hypothetical protein
MVESGGKNHSTSFPKTKKKLSHLNESLFDGRSLSDRMGWAGMAKFHHSTTVEKEPFS